MNTEYGFYNGKNIGLFMIKNFLKDLVRPITNKYVLFKLKSIWNVKEYINKNKLKSGIYTSFYIDYFNKRNSYIGLNTNFKNEPHFPHGISGIFISDSAKIGKNAIIFQGVTIGSNTIEGSKGSGAPTIGDNVYIGTGAKIIGNVKVGDNVRIGANAIVVEDIPDNSVVVLNKPRVIVKKEKLDNRYIKKIGNDKYYYEDGKFIKF